MSRLLRPKSRGHRNSSIFDDGSNYGGRRNSGGSSTFLRPNNNGYGSSSSDQVFFESEVSLIHRYGLSGNDPFSPYASQLQIDQNYRKRQSRCRIFALDDRFKLEKRHGLGKEPFRNELTYAEIVDSETGQSRPEYLVLSIATQRGMRYYEVYKFRNTDDSRRFNELVHSAMRSPDHRLRQMPLLRKKRFSEFGNQRARSIASLGPSEYDDYEVGSRASIFSNDDRRSYSSDDFGVRSSSANLVSSGPQMGSTHSIRSGHDGLSYISYHPRRGPIEADAGPIYLFSSGDPDAPLHLSTMSERKEVATYCHPISNNYY